MKYIILLLVIASTTMCLYTECNKVPISTGWIIIDIAVLWGAVIWIFMLIWEKLRFNYLPDTGGKDE